ncbi:sulfotransferase [Planctomycetales bacterium ZRK34]|nr:sulfotransferase [Planctomycetales bacterium ZRK34]
MNPIMTCDNPTRYLIIGLPRSATTLVHLTIMGHPNVAALTDEMLVLPFFEKGLSTFTFGNEEPREKEMGHRAIFDAFTSILADEHTTHIGAKTCAQTPEQAIVLVNALQNHLPDLKVILTVRSNLVAQYGSLLSARFSGAWHAWNAGAETAKSKQVKFIRPMYIRYLLDCLDTMKTLRTLHASHDVHEVVYEQMSEDMQGHFDAMYRFLGLDPIPLPQQKAKKVKAPPEQYIYRYPDMVDYASRIQDLHDNGQVPGRLRAVQKWVNKSMRTYYRLRKRG